MLMGQNGRESNQTGAFKTKPQITESFQQGSVGRKVIWANERRTSTKPVR
eukprot:CAMPEP_0174335906 /NCGR_PEP_ID=MMETSP0810-20121108/21165_1 /TAXON_ID=73025 ORGANISM="Eutreptiella gymnastica-like, Strain CCMP1594" /NCGR_SAMPLE_ID=MMETSP0810 /ASSEMBLY_ACC=CAM_ASM_000659 /LENGTH=49 /DNA_ID=CAMNT_0015454581 /DNA_START=318 /DNA_END=467 /DNA_ORIENTATION=-